MWSNRRLVELFKIEHPIVLAPMAGFCTQRTVGFGEFHAQEHGVAYYRRNARLDRVVLNDAQFQSQHPRKS
ncbi:hypothetical protein JEY40_33915 [Bradyrhizobium japonicum]|uniref:hypothetical protein n=1 Tax=Bradyrhizobium japonicum TaxID=375 RepID=UPI000A4A0FE1|nr:hypothetical protein [Bradyrhizobium japonicum]MCS3497565.1 NAD(P)H-dependent flavin oxidoreductase YrpB (nitropropane dioxygenase family) [Bradyrhizobium japonicum]MCS3960274.1 NAD(P)H-dependent flavin oxidoreductase YrpB (nitropropane dioxygenase family) [Bradyrhizobium japonicum]MCS4002027.1 NAD(P)H-dependent flavin oxidoreductase YrpB (nitropropane dioxygenase family) [Bradyrhizobium japonicum]MCW2220847.1 NAD(P)H-dependent flavin oxidoreductase YrpB (nitropropane dioxygenase family) [Br